MRLHILLAMAAIPATLFVALFLLVPVQAGGG
jgi:hypothetical protein